VSAREGRGVSSAGLFITASLVWGSTWLAITYQLGPVAPEVSVTYRFALAALLLALWCRATGRSLRFARERHPGIAAQGATMFGVNYVLIYWAEQYVASGLVAVLFSTIVFMNMIASRCFFSTPLTPRGVAGAALGVAGVALLFLPELAAAQSGGRAALGVALALVSALLSCAGNMFAVRNQRAGIPVLTGTAWGMAYGAITAALTATVFGVPWTFDTGPAYVGSLVYLALLGSIVAFVAYLTLVQRIGAGPASYTGVATPVLAMVLSTLLEGYRWTWVAAAGVLLAVAGNVLVLRSPRRATGAAVPAR
jgi:drug/metabolite transporter (DMT)-like permease